MKTKTQISCAVTAQLISAFVFASRMVQFHFYSNPKFQASSIIMRLYRPVCVKPSRKTKLLFFSCEGIYDFTLEFFLARLHEVHRAIAVTPVVHVPVPVPVRVRVRVRVTLALKFSRSPYLDNHSSESIHTWTIDTL